MMAPDSLSLSVIILSMLGFLVLVALFAPFGRYCWGRCQERANQRKLEIAKEELEREQEAFNKKYLELYDNTTDLSPDVSQHPTVPAVPETDVEPHQAAKNGKIFIDVQGADEKDKTDGDPGDAESPRKRKKKKKIIIIKKKKKAKKQNIDMEADEDEIANRLNSLDDLDTPADPENLSRLLEMPEPARAKSPLPEELAYKR